MGQGRRRNEPDLDKDVELNLADRVEFTEAILDSLPVGVVVADNNGRFVVWNRAATDLIGRGPTQIPIDDWSAAYQIYEADGLTPYPVDRLPMVRALRGESTNDMPMVLGRLESADRVPIIVSGRPIQDSAGNPRGGVVMLFDVAERSRLETALRLSEERYRIVIEQTGQLIYDYDILSGRIYWAGAVEELTHESLECFQEVDIAAWEARIHPEDRERALALLERAVARSGQYRVEYRFLRADGSYFDCEDNGRVLADERGIAARMLGAMKDVTARKLAEQDRLRLEARLRDARRLEALGRLAGGVAHDFNNLLMPILGYSEMLLSRFGPNGAGHRELEQIRTAAERARDLTRQLLAVGRRQVLEVHPVDLNREVLRFEPILRRLVREDVELRLDLEPELGAIRADPSQLEQILINFVVNSREAMPSGGSVTIQTRSAGGEDRSPTRSKSLVGHVLLSVTDTGHGMDAETRAKVFEPFFTTKQTGSGLGLATVYGIVGQHGGVVWVESEPGQGATFTVAFPSDAATPDPPAAPQPSTRTEQGTEVILLAEDETLVRELVRSALEELGYRVLEATNGEEALRIAESYPGRIDLLVTDVIMPRTNGRQLRERLRESRPNIPVLFISGYTEDIIAGDGMLDHDLDVLMKPFSLAQLAARVRDALGRADA